MKALAAQTGGAAFFPDSLGNLDHRLSELQQVIRSQYLISYRPAEFEANGAYRFDRVDCPQIRASAPGLRPPRILRSQEHRRSPLTAKCRFRGMAGPFALRQRKPYSLVK
jgi:hypothetical protein